MCSVTCKLGAMGKEKYIEEIKRLWFDCETEDNTELLYRFYRKYYDVLYEFWNDGENQYMCHIYNMLCKKSCEIYSFGAKNLMGNPNLLKIWQKWNYIFNDDKQLIQRNAELKAQCIISLYDELAKYEDDIYFVGGRAKLNQEHRIYNTNEMIQVLNLYIICEDYHNQYEYIRNLFEKARESNKSEKLPKKLDTQKAKSLFEKIPYCEKDGNLYKWNGSPSLFGYFVDKTSDFLGIRPSNNRKPWSIYAEAFQMSKKSISTAKSAVNDYKNKSISEPEGYYEIKKNCNN